MIDCRLERTLWAWTGLAVVTEVVLIVYAVVTYDADDFVTSMTLLAFGTVLLFAAWGVGVAVVFATSGLVDRRRKRRARFSSS